MSEFESSQVSQAVPVTEAPPLKGQKSPLLAGLCNSASVSELDEAISGHDLAIPGVERKIF
jgi:hypothetical protein